MAYLTHISGEQLSQTRLKAKANFDEVVSTTAVLAADIIEVRSGMGLAAFRDACRANFAQINSDLTVAGLVTIDDGDMLWTVRDKLNTNFALIDALP